MPATAFPGKIKHFSLCCHLLHNVKTERRIFSHLAKMARKTEQYTSPFHNYVLQNDSSFQQAF